MIPFDFEYYKPDSVAEAVNLFTELDSRGKHPLYYSGGTEIISMARLNSVFTQAVIDIKGIPECNVLEIRDNQLIIGAAVTMTRILESNLFPLLGKSGGRIADHTIRDKITLGGNLCGKIIYREAALPLLLADCRCVIAGITGRKTVLIHEVFAQTFQLNGGELLVQVVMDPEYTTLPHVGIKRTRLDKIDYPLVSLAAIKKDRQVRISLSGLCAYPFRSLKVEEELNRPGLTVITRIRNAVKHLPAPILSDIQASAEYRLFVLEKTLLQTLTALESERCHAV